MDRRFWKKSDGEGPGEGRSSESESGVTQGSGQEAEERSKDNPGPKDEKEQDENIERKEEQLVCPKCGAPVDTDAKFCNECAAPLSEYIEKTTGKGKLKDTRLRPWAVKAGARFSGISRGIKIGVPVAIIIIVVVLVTLFSVAAGHSPAATVSDYLSRLKVGDYSGAYDLLVHQGGQFSSLEYFQRWQDIQSDKLGRLLDFRIKPGQKTKGFFEGLLSEEPLEGTPFTATLIYVDKTFDVNITVEDAGGAWPTKRYRLRLSEDSSRFFTSARGAEVYIDDEMAGRTEEDEELKDALSLKDLPDDFDGAVDYVRKLLQVFENVVDEVKRIARGLDTVVEDVRRIFDKVGTSGVSWDEVTDSVDNLVDQSKQFGSEVVREAINIYWMFGGGDDGSFRAELERSRNLLEVNNLPDGYHEIRVKLPGAKPVTEEFYAPGDLDIELKPTRETEKTLEETVESYYREVIYAQSSLIAAGLTNVISGELLEQEDKKIQDLLARGERVVSELTSVKFENIELRTKDVATVETKETWNKTTFQGRVAVSTKIGLKQDVVYTLERGKDDVWKVTERKVD